MKTHLTQSRFLQTLDRYLGDPCEFIASVFIAGVLFLIVGRALLEVIDDAIKERDLRAIHEASK